MRIKRLGLIAKKNHPGVAPLYLELQRWCAAHQIEILAEPWLSELGGAKRYLAREQVGAAVDVLVVMGGDGTMLAASHGKGERPPILGINLGHLGFLTEFSKEELRRALDLLLADEPVFSSRHTLHTSLVRGGEEIETWLALNDAVIAKGALARMIELGTRVDGRPMTVYKSDGIIVATPTGSTAYSMAAGGPIVHPKVPCLLVTPICPHTLSQRTMVLPEGKRLEVEVLSAAEEIFLSIDGQYGRSLQQGDVVKIRRADAAVRLIRSPHRDYFEVLRQKLKWGER